MATEAEPLLAPDVQHFGREWRMQRFRHALRKRLDLDFADAPEGVTPEFDDPQAVRTINYGIYSLYLDVRQEGLPLERLEAAQRIRDLRDSLYAPPKADLSWLPF